MNKTVEITLDFDHTISSTEDRFNVRHFLEDFVDTINNQSQETLTKFISGGATADGFSEFTMQKREILDMFKKRFFGRRSSYISLSNLKLSFSKSLFHIHGVYEEYIEDILSSAGSIDLSLMKVEDSYEFVQFKFYPRMRSV